MSPDISPALRVLTDTLVDDAGLFPPAELSLTDALRRHRADRQAGHPVLSGRFVCPLGRLPELKARLDPADRIALSVILRALPADLAELDRQLGADPRLELRSVEVAPGSDPTSVAAALDRWGEAVVVFIELGVGPTAPDELTDLAQQGWAAKVRCGGVRAELFPAAADLAGFLVAATDQAVPVKATAGLHHAVSHHDPVTGFSHFGFLNLLLAVHRAQQGGTVRAVAGVLLDRDATALAEQARQLSVEQAQRIRAALRSYGSCSTAVPITDLDRLGLVEHERRSDA